jgi:hypothetical protein
MTLLRDGAFDVYTDVISDEYTATENTGIARRFCARDFAMHARAALEEVVAIAKNIVSETKFVFLADVFERYRIAMHKLRSHPRTDGVRRFIQQCESLVLFLFSVPAYSESAMKAFDNWRALVY